MEKSNILTTQELSKYLKLNEKTVIKMAQSGELPGFKVGNQWRFYLSTIDEYLQDKIVRSSKYDLTSVLQTKEDILPLSRLVSKDCVNLYIDSDSKDKVLYQLAETAHKAGIATSQENLLIHLKQREQMLSTGVGNGIAIPHPRNPSDSLFTKAAVIIARTRKGINFDSFDGRNVFLFFMPCSPDVVIHLKLLSKIAKLLEKKDIFKDFMNAETAEDIIKILLESERFNVFKPAVDRNAKKRK
ncbi:MAG: PTS sugar transporter subunit IIA [Candidatus Omnitrophica bacterium]|nr:PTS sugar transporter subunit IIA [Candidatus Omnitrophota bacterium]